MMKTVEMKMKDEEAAQACGDDEEKTQSLADVAVAFGAASSYGARSYMEDFYSANVVLNDVNMGLFGVFDGHGGPNVAEFCANNIHVEVAARMSGPEPADLHQSLISAFLQMDEYLRADYEQATEAADEEEEEEECCAGSTAVVAAIDYPSRKIVVANVGDSRAILSRNGRATDLARAHEPEDADEKVRIEAAGGKIMPNGYLSNASESSTLSMSRSIGDFEFKMDKSLSLEQQMVIAVPEILQQEFSGDEDFLVLASDGIWMPSQEIVDLVAAQKKEGVPLTTICQNLIAKADANDNMTAIIVDLARWAQR